MIGIISVKEFDVDMDIQKLFIGKIKVSILSRGLYES